MSVNRHRKAEKAVPCQTEVKAGPTARPEDEAVERLIMFLNGQTSNSRSLVIQLEQMRKWMGDTLTKHPSVAVAMAGNESIQRFVLAWKGKNDG